MITHLTLLLLLAASDALVYREDVNVTDFRQWVNLGGLFPLSWNVNGKCGMLSTTAVEQVEAMVFAIRRINEDPLLLPNVSLTFDIRDTCAVPSRALELAIDYIHDVNGLPISGLIGSAFTDSSILVANILGLFNIPQISYESTGAVLSDKSRYNYFFRTIPPDTLQVKAIASLIFRFNWTYVFAFYSDDTYGEDGIMSLTEELQSQSDMVCLALQVSLPIAASEDDPTFDMAVEEMSAEWVRNSSVAILFGHIDQANGMLSAVERRLRADPNSNSHLSEITWIGSDSWGTILGARFRSTARGMLAVQPIPTAIPEFANYFTSLRPSTTENPWFRGYWESVLNCNLTLNNCSPELNKNMTLNSQHPNIVRAVFATAVALDTMLQQKCDDEILCDSILITKENSEVVNGALLRSYLLNVSLSNIDIFDENGLLFNRNGDVQISYSIFNLQTTNANNMFEYRPVGSWDHINQLNLNVSNIEWTRGEGVPQSLCSLPCGPGQEPVNVPGQEQCCSTCRTCLGEFSVSSGDRCYECKELFIPNSDRSNCMGVAISYLTWTDPLGIVIIVLASIGIVCCLGTGIMFLVFFTNSVIKASSRELSTILLIGILLCYIIPLIYLVKPSAGSCAIQRLISGLCFALVYSALLIKTNRIHRIFNHSNSNSLSPRFVGPISQVVFTLSLAFVQLLIASIWLAVEPPRVKTMLVNRRFLELVCDHSPHATLVVTVMYNLILLVTSAYFAFRARNVPELFNEAKFITITVFSLCVIWLAFVPTFYISTTVSGGSEFQTFSLLLTLILSASTTLSCLLLPKLVVAVVLKVKGTPPVDTTVNTISSSQI